MAGPSFLVPAETRDRRAGSRQSILLLRINGLVGSDGTRTATSDVTGRRSHQLNYAPANSTSERDPVVIARAADNLKIGAKGLQCT
jgi:hypothetical protein